MKTEILDIPIYCTSVCFMIGGDSTAFNILCEENPSKFGKEEIEECLYSIEHPNKCDAFVSTCEDGTYFMYSREKESKIPRVYTHELCHIAHRILRDRSIDLSEETEEAYTYLIGWLVEQYLEVIGKD